MVRTAAILAVALLAACGGGSDGPDEPDAGRPIVGRGEARRIVARAQLEVADLGPGWAKTADTPTAPEQGGELQGCVGDDLDVAAETLAQSNTRTFDGSPDGETQHQITSSTSVLATPADWRTFFRVVGSERFATCDASVLADEIAGTEGSDVTATPGEATTTASGRAGARRVRIVAPMDIRLEQEPLGGRLDLLLVGRDQAVSVVVAFSVGTPLAEDVVPRLADLLLDRQAAA
jgi:hypothetical protein